MKLENRICSCGCGHSFRCLPSSATRYASRNCMEVAGVLPPVEKFGRAGKVARPAGRREEKHVDPIEAEAPLLLEEDEALEAGAHKEKAAKLTEMALT